MRQLAPPAKRPKGSSLSAKAGPDVLQAVDITLFVGPDLGRIPTLFIVRSAQEGCHGLELVLRQLPELPRPVVSSQPSMTFFGVLPLGSNGTSRAARIMNVK